MKISHLRASVIVIVVGGNLLFIIEALFHFSNISFSFILPLSLHEMKRKRKAWNDILNMKDDIAITEDESNSQKKMFMKRYDEKW